MSNGQLCLRGHRIMIRRARPIPGQFSRRRFYCPRWTHCSSALLHSVQASTKKANRKTLTFRIKRFAATASEKCDDATAWENGVQQNLRSIVYLPEQSARTKPPQLKKRASMFLIPFSYAASETIGTNSQYRHAKDSRLGPTARETDHKAQAECRLTKSLITLEASLIRYRYHHNIALRPFRSMAQPDGS